MNWYKKAQINNQYLYHGTSEGAFRKIREEGLIPNRGFIWFSKNIQYAKTYSERKGSNTAGIRVLRVLKTPDMLRDKRIIIPGDYITNRNIPPQEIEVLVENRWVPIQEYNNPNINIMPYFKENK